MIKVTIYTMLDYGRRGGEHPMGSHEEWINPAAITRVRDDFGKAVITVDGQTLHTNIDTEELIRQLEGVALIAQ